MPGGIDNREYQLALTFLSLSISSPPSPLLLSPLFSLPPILLPLPSALPSPRLSLTSSYPSPLPSLPSSYKSMLRGGSSPGCGGRSGGRKPPRMGREFWGRQPPKKDLRSEAETSSRAAGAPFFLPIPRALQKNMRLPRRHNKKHTPRALAKKHVPAPMGTRNTWSDWI